MKKPEPQRLGAGRVAVVLCAQRPGAHEIFVRNAGLVRDWLVERGYTVPAPIHARRGVNLHSAAGGHSRGGPGDGGPVGEGPDRDDPAGHGPSDAGDAFRAENMAAPANDQPTNELPRLYTDEALRSALTLDPAPRVVLTLGGTGLHPSDQTPQLTADLVDFEVPGIMHAIWKRGLESVDNAVMSRGTAGVAGRTFIVNLPSSKGGIRDGLAVLDSILHLIQAQIEDEQDQWPGSDWNRQENGMGSTGPNTPSQGQAVR